MTKASLILSMSIAAASITAQANEALDSIYVTASKNEQLQERAKGEIATLALKNSEAMSLGLKSLMHTDAIKDRLTRPEFYINDAKAEFLSIRVKDLKQVLSSIDVLLKSEDCIKSKCKDLVQFFDKTKEELKGFEMQISALNKSMRGE